MPSFCRPSPMLSAPHQLYHTAPFQRRSVVCCLMARWHRSTVDASMAEIAARVLPRRQTMGHPVNLHWESRQGHPQKISRSIFCSIRAMSTNANSQGMNTSTKERDCFYTKLLQGYCCYWKAGTNRMVKVQA